MEFTHFHLSGIWPCQTDFYQTYPEIKIDLLFDDDYVDLVKKSIDLAIRIGPLEDVLHVVPVLRSEEGCQRQKLATARHRKNVTQ